ncbi:hypothetical protein Csa_011374, partial [Cucumis sativus]
FAGASTSRTLQTYPVSLEKCPWSINIFSSSGAEIKLHNFTFSFSKDEFHRHTISSIITNL